MWDAPICRHLAYGPLLGRPAIVVEFPQFDICLPHSETRPAGLPETHPAGPPKKRPPGPASPRPPGPGSPARRHPANAHLETTPQTPGTAAKTKDAKATDTKATPRPPPYLTHPTSRPCSLSYPRRDPRPLTTCDPCLVHIGYTYPQNADRPAAPCSGRRQTAGGWIALRGPVHERFTPAQA